MATMNEDEEIVYESPTELYRNKRVSDRTFERTVERAEKRFGKKGLVDLLGRDGYCTLLATAESVRAAADA